MIPLPKWVLDVLNQSFCPNEKCNKPLTKRGVVGIGIREEVVKRRKMQSFCYEYDCPYCKQKTAFTGFPTTFNDFILDLIDLSESFPEKDMPEFVGEVMDGPKDMDDDSDYDETPKHRWPPKKSRITEKEMKECIKFLNETEFYDDFLEKLGIKKLDKEAPDENK